MHLKFRYPDFTFGKLTNNHCHLPKKAPYLCLLDHPRLQNGQFGVWSAL